MKRTSLLLIFLFLFAVNVFSYSSVYSSGFSVVWKLPKFVPVPSQTEFVISGSDVYVYLSTGDSPANVSMSYSVYPITSFITMDFSENNFSLGAQSERYIYVRLQISKDTPDGTYNVTVRVAVVIGANQNVINKAYEFIITVKVGGKAYGVNVFLRNPDGAPTYGLIRVAYLMNNNTNCLFEAYGYEAFFYLVEGEYLFEGVVGSFKISKVMNISSDINVTLVVSTIIIDSFAIVHEPEKPDDVFVFELVLKSIDPLAFNQNVSVFYDLVKEDNETIVNRSMVATLLINGRTKARVRGIVEPPGYWSNATYTIRIYVSSPKKILYTLEQPITVGVRISLMRPESEIPAFVVILYPAIGGAIGALIMYVFLTRVAVIEIGWRRRIVLRYLGIWNTFFLVYYNVNRYKFLEIKDELMRRLLPLLAILPDALESAWKDNESPMPISALTQISRIIAYPIKNGFVVFGEFSPETFEYDKKILRFFRSLRNELIKLIDKYEISTYEEFSYGLPNFVGELEEIFQRTVRKYGFIISKNRRNKRSNRNYTKFAVSSYLSNKK